MSNAFPMRAFDKVDVRISLKATIAVRLDRIARGAGLSRAALISGYLEQKLDDMGIALTADDVKAVNEIIKRNREERAAKILKMKGGK
jgi:GTP cyclohydrolase FolE2